MKDAEFEVQCERIRALADKWIVPLGLGWWRIDLAFTDDAKEVPSHRDDVTPIATCEADWRYAHATITWYIPQVTSQDDAALEGIYVHELMHVFLNEAREVGKGDGEIDIDHEERVATTLAKAFLWLREHLEPTITILGGIE